MLRRNEDTIASVSSGQGESAIAVIRISGDKARIILQRIFVANKPKNTPNVLSVGWIIDPETGQKIDQVMAVFFEAPHTFTGEDLVEIYCHGGILIIRRIIEQILKFGGRLADRGEFSKRAFLNGKIDLVQAEAITEAIKAKTSYGLLSAMYRIEGKLSKEIRGIKDALEQALAEIEASTDFPEDVEEPNRNEMIKKLSGLKKTCDDLIKNANAGKLLNDGIRVLILGKPNSGKSSLLNAMLKEERAIVTEIPGTTTDTIEAMLNIDGLPFLMTDTAGIRAPQNSIESEGIKRAIGKIDSTDIVLAVFDFSEKISEEDKMVIREIKNIQNKIAALNKTDKMQAIDTEEIARVFEKVIQTSALTGEGIRELEQAIADLARKETDPSSEPAFLGNERQVGLINNARTGIESAISSISEGAPIDLISIDIKEALAAISELNGQTISEDIIDRIFESFCIGK